MHNESTQKKLAAEIRQLYRTNDQDRSTAVIEDYLKSSLQEYPANQQLALLKRLQGQFTQQAEQTSSAPQINQKALSKLISLLLGKRSEEIDCSSEEVVEKFASSLNTVFDSLNEIIAGINTTFMSNDVQTDETIRLVISSHIDNDQEILPLEKYLSQIKEAFAVSHEAFQKAARSKMKEMLADLSPTNIASITDSGLKVGPFHKAEMFNIFMEKHKTLEKWLNSGVFLEALLREFEKNCQILYSQKRR